MTLSPVTDDIPVLPILIRQPVSARPPRTCHTDVGAIPKFLEPALVLDPSSGRRSALTGDLPSWCCWRSAFAGLAGRRRALAGTLTAWRRWRSAFAGLAGRRRALTGDLPTRCGWRSAFAGLAARRRAFTGNPTARRGWRSALGRGLPARCRAGGTSATLVPRVLVVATTPLVGTGWIIGLGDDSDAIQKRQSQYGS
jgi:hypothetical protein